jgi:hypothetical protein
MPDQREKVDLTGRELWIAPLSEGALILLVSLTGYFLRQPFIFASLGPTAFELVEAPERRSARAYNVIAGHAIGIAAGFAGLALAHAWQAPTPSHGDVVLPRVLAAACGATLTVLLTLLARATQPAAISTSLLISLGIMQRPWDAGIILASVVLMVVAAEPVRRWRVRERQKLYSQQRAVNPPPSQSAA